MASSYIGALGSEQVVETLRTSSIRLQDVYDGRPLTIDIVIPPEKLESHKSISLGPKLCLGPQIREALLRFGGTWIRRHDAKRSLGTRKTSHPSLTADS
jgi:hypothetical protein